jgi:hypothetical protein
MQNPNFCEARKLTTSDSSSRKRLWLGRLFLGLVLALSFPEMHAQVNTGSIAGTVMDPTGSVLSGAKVVVMQKATGQEKSLQTDGEGHYQANLLQPGVYQVSADASGFRHTVRDDIEVQVNLSVRLDFSLTVGSSSQLMEVSAAPPLLDTERSSLGTIEEEKRVVDLPLNGRNFVLLAGLGPGVNAGVAGAAGSGATFETGRANLAFSVNGMGVLNNNFLLDGLDNNEFGNSVAIAVPPPDAIQEFRIESNAMSAEFGRGGAAVNLTLKSGTNSFHGGLYEFLRNDAVDARNYFDVTKTPYKRNQFGATFGGPILKNKTFFFLDYQGTRVRQALPFFSRVPTMADRGGNLADVLDSHGNPVTLIDPLTGGLLNPSAPSQIPSTRIDTVGQNVINLYPLPNLTAAQQQQQGGNNYFADQTAPRNENSFDVRINHSIRESDSLSGHYTYDDYTSTNPAPLGSLGGEFCCPNNGENKAQTSGISWTHLFSPSVVNTLQGGYTRYLVHANPFNLGKNLGDQLGIPNANRGDSVSSGLPFFSISGYTPLGDSAFTPEFVAENIYQIGDTISIVHGKHSVKVGIDFLRQQRNFFQTQYPRGEFTISGVYTGTSLGDLLLGIPNSSERDTLRSRDYTRYWQLAEFVQDDIRLTSKLTVNLGLRYDIFSPAGKNVANFNLQTAVVDVGYGPNAKSYAGVAFDKNDWGPRIGLAYSPFNDNKTVLKSAFGIFYGAPGNGFDDIGENPPLLAAEQQSYSSSGTPGPGQALSAGFPATVTFSDPLHPAGGVKTAGSKHLLPRMFEWNLSLQHQFGDSWVLQAGYVGTHGYRMWNHEVTNLDQPTQPLDSNFSDATGNFGRPYFAQQPNLSTILPIDVPQFQMSYNSFQTSLTKRFSNGLNMLVAYTLGHNIGNTDAQYGGTIQNPYNLRAAFGPVPPDIRHRLSASVLYELPVGKGRRYLANSGRIVDAFLGGWQVTGITTVQSGQAFSGALSFDPTNTGTFIPLPDQIHNPRDFSFDVADQGAIFGCSRPGHQTLDCYYNQTAFAVPPLAPGQTTAHQFGNAPVNGLRGPDLINQDFGLIKNFHITERQQLQFRAEAFNIANHPNFDLPGGARPISVGFPATVDVPGGAAITSTLPDNQREIQFALKYSF